jgi:hypothetical protein
MTGNDVETKRYLTKSRFKLAMECPTKLFYTGKPAIYPDRMREDAFLQALAEGGFQVGELAKIMFPGGIEIKSRGHDAQVAETAQELRKTDVTVFEAAIRHGDFFVRADILRKTGNRLDLIEVKAKSFDPESCNGFRGARGGIDSEMRPYLEDIAFQRHVLGLAFPQMTVHSFLMLADTSRTASVDGLNQRFRIRNEGGRPVVDVAPGTDARTIGAPVLACVNVDELVDEILGSQHTVPGATGTVAELAAIWARQYRDDLRISPTLGRQCGTCQFRTDAPTGQQQSGFHACWQDAAGLGAAEIARGTVLDLWNYRRKQALIADGKYLLSHVDLGDLANGKAKARPGKPGTAMAGLDHARRQEMQVTGIWPGSKDFFIDTAFLRGEMSGWRSRSSPGSGPTRISPSSSPITWSMPKVASRTGRSSSRHRRADTPIWNSCAHCATRSDRREPCSCGRRMKTRPSSRSCGTSRRIPPRPRMPPNSPRSSAA